MRPIKYESDEHLERLKARALALKPNQPNVIATANGWEKPMPFGMELLVSFSGLDEILGIEALVDSNQEPIEVKVQDIIEEQVTAIEDESGPVLEKIEELDEDDEETLPKNDLASLIIAKPIEKVKETRHTEEKPDLSTFLEIAKEDEVEEVVELAPKKRGGRTKKVAE